MKKKILLLTVLFCAAYSHAQDCSIALTGTFQLDPTVETGLYDAFAFDGAGTVKIHAGLEFRGDFFQIGDTVIVYPDKSVFTFLMKDERTLVGLDTWVKDQVFREMENDTVIAPVQQRAPEYAEQCYEFYKLTGKDNPGLLTYLDMHVDSVLRMSMDTLCEKGFAKACIVLANTFMLDSPALTSYFAGTYDENEVMVPDEKVVYYFRKAAELNSLDAMAQLGSYYLMLGDKEAARETFEKGCLLGHLECCLAGVALDMEQENE